MAVASGGAGGAAAPPCPQMNQTTIKLKRLVVHQMPRNCAKRPLFPLCHRKGLRVPLHYELEVFVSFSCFCFLVGRVSAILGHLKRGDASGYHQVSYFYSVVLFVTSICVSIEHLCCFQDDCAGFNSLNPSVFL